MKSVAGYEIKSRDLDQLEDNFLQMCRDLRAFVFDMDHSQDLNKTNLAFALDTSRTTLYKMLDNYENLTIKEAAEMIDYARRNKHSLKDVYKIR